MDFSLAIRSVTSTVDYFKPLHVDTNIEYCLDMEKFPEINNTSHHWEPALMIAANSDLPSDLCDMELTSFSEDGDISLEVTQADIHDLLEALDAEDLQFDDVGNAEYRSNSLWTTSERYSSETSLESQTTDKNLPCWMTARCQSNDSLAHFDYGNHEPVNNGKRKRHLVDVSEDIPVFMDSVKRHKPEMNGCSGIYLECTSVGGFTRDC